MTLESDYRKSGNEPNADHSNSDYVGYTLYRSCGTYK